jgi:hypothetical protein
MIPVKSDVEITDEMESVERIEFKIADPRKMMRMGARQYSDPITAVIRELFCNAYDAHVEAGEDRPVEIVLPTLDDNRFIVRDYGTGMDRDIFRDVYTQFGFSTKEHTNDQTGSLGLGSKSPLAYTDTFAVSSVKDGYETMATVTRRADWSIFLDVVGYRKTDKHNGTTVEIEVEPIHVSEFRTKAEELFKFVLPGRAVVAYGSQATYNEIPHYVGNKIGKNLYEARDWNLSWIVMGNVPYRVINARALFEGMRINPMNFVAYVEMDEENGIDFTPSREDLEYTPRTKATLRRVIKDFEDQMLSEAAAELDGVSTHADAYKTWKKWTDLLGRRLFDDLEFKGDKFEDTFDVDGYRYEVGRRRNGTWHIDSWHIRHMENTLIVTEFVKDLTSSHKQKVRDWMDHVDRDMTYVIYTHQDSIESPWVDQNNIVTWETIKTQTPKKVRTTNSNGVPLRVPGSWDYYTINGRQYEKELPKTGKVFYIDACRVDNDDDYYVIRKMSKIGLDKDAAVIRLGANRKAKFLRENPKVEEFITFAKAKVNMNPAGLLTKDAKTVLSLSTEDRGLVENLDHNKIDDPEWKKLHTLLKGSAKLTEKYHAALALAQEFGMWYSVKRYEPTTKHILSTRYPLLDRLQMRYYGYRNKDDIYLYINAKYAQLKKEKKV